MERDDKGGAVYSLKEMLGDTDSATSEHMAQMLGAMFGTINNT